MSISLATKGRLWPTGGTLVIREQFVDIVATITDPLEVTLVMEEVVNISAVVETSGISATVEVTEVAGEVDGVVEVDGTIKEC
jgi:hypothetical protein